MRQERIVSVETAVALRQVYTALADFIHQHKLEQIVGAGPSAYPHTLAVARAYKNRHGKELKVFNLGELGEKLSTRDFLDKKREALELLKRHRPTLDLSRNTLVFDETTDSGRTLRNLKNLLHQNKPGVKCRTAILHHTGVIGFRAADFPGLNEMALFGEGVRIHRGFNVYLARRKRKPKLGECSAWPAFMAQLHGELREIADLVPKA